MIETLRDFIEILEENNELVRIKREVDTKFEITAVLKKLEKEEGPAAYFEAVRGYECPVVGNVLTTRHRIAMSIGTEERKISDRYLEAFGRRTPASSVPEGPVKEIQHVGDDVDVLEIVPVLWHNEGDVGPYITAGCVMTNDPISRARISQVIEMLVKGPRKFGISPVSSPMTEIFTRAEEQGRSLAVAVVLGADPATFFASCTPVPIGVDRLEVAGAFRGTGHKLVKSETVDVEVPSSAEYVIEGEILPKEREDMGPFGDYVGYYWSGKFPVMNVKAITHRAKPLYQALLADGFETVNMIAIPYESELLRYLRTHAPGVTAVYMPPSGRAHTAVVAIRKRHDQDAKHLIYNVFGSPAYALIDRVIVVDEDIDVYDAKEVEWAVTTRVFPEEDIIILTDLYGDPVNPPTRNGRASKVGIDATQKQKLPPERARRVKVPDEIKAKVEKEWESYLKGY